MGISKYCSIYYKDDIAIQNDIELQSWWKEFKERGHANKKDEPWWPKMQTLTELIETCTIIIWIALALHATINFGQYPYGGFIPNRTTMSHRFMQEEGSAEYENLKRILKKGFLKTINFQVQWLLVMSLIEILSRHTSDEVYVRKRTSVEWTSDKDALEAFEKFGRKILEVEERIMERNSDVNSKNRIGPANLPYTERITGREILNSIFI